MRGVVAIDGQVVPAIQATVPVMDRGFLYGDSVYEVIRTYGGKPFALEEHVERLERSAEMVEIKLSLSKTKLIQEVRHILEIAGEGEWYIRIIVTRGGGPIGIDPALADTPRRVILVLPIPDFPQSYRTKGVSVALVTTSRGVGDAVPSGAKTGNYLTNIMALRRARDQGAFEAIMVDAAGRLGEGTSSNVFILSHGVLMTPPLAAGILDGITRRKVIELCENAGIEIRQEHLHPLDIHTAQEVFLTATLKEVLPVTRVDGQPVGDGLPGPVTRRVQELYQQHIRGLVP